MTAEEIKARERSKQWDQKQTAAAKSAAEKKAYDASLQVEVVSYSNAKSPLEIAIEEASDLDASALTESLDRLDFKKTEADQVGLIFANALVDDKFNLTKFMDAVKARLTDRKDDISTLVRCVISALSNKADRTRRKVLDGYDTQYLIGLIAADKSEEETDAFLLEQGLYFLKPVPDITDEVNKALGANTDPDALLELINSKVDASQSPSELAPIITEHVLSLVFESKNEPNLEIISVWAPVLIRCESDAGAEAQVLFAAQRCWYRAGGQRKFIRPLFEKLYDTKVVSFDGLAIWRDDRTKSNSKGKAQALLGCNNWITEITPPEPEEEEDEEEDEEEVIDEYLRNPNSEFF